MTTIDLVRQLEATGFKREQAETQVKVMTNFTKDLATKKDIEELGKATKKDIENLHLSTKKDIENLRVSTKKDIEDLHLSTKKDIENLHLSTKKEIEDLRLSTKKDIENLRVSTKKDIEYLRFDIDDLRNNLNDLRISAKADLENGLKGLEAKIDLKLESIRLMIHTQGQSVVIKLGTLIILLFGFAPHIPAIIKWLTGK